MKTFLIAFSLMILTAGFLIYNPEPVCGVIKILPGLDTSQKGQLQRKWCHKPMATASVETKESEDINNQLKNKPMSAPKSFNTSSKNREIVEGKEVVGDRSWKEFDKEFIKLSKLAFAVLETSKNLPKRSYISRVQVEDKNTWRNVGKEFLELEKLRLNTLRQAHNLERK